MPKWKGLRHYTHVLMNGGVQEPRIKKTTSGENASTDIQYYESLHKDYRWFRQDELVRRCVVINGYFATMTAGFETELEAVGPLNDNARAAVLEKYAYVKTEIDAVNKLVNMDRILFVSQVKRSIYGSCGWEIVLDDNKFPKWLLSLIGDKIKPKIDTNWQIEKFEYESKDPLPVDEVLYFENLQLEQSTDTCRGLSDIEPIRDVCKARHHLLREDFPEITKTLWAPYALLSADTTGMTTTEEDAFLDGLLQAARSGKSLAVNRSVEGQVIKIDINLQGLALLIDKLEDSIVRAFDTPKFLINKHGDLNRATAFAELEAYVQGPISFIQRYFKRELERQWYDPLTAKILEKHGVKNEMPVVVKHKWNVIRAADIYAMAQALSQLYSDGLGILGEMGDEGKEIAFNMMGWNKDYLKKWQIKLDPTKSPS